VISRHRGEHHAQGLWHPRRASAASAPALTASELAGARTARRRRSRARSTLAMLAVAIGLFAVSAGQGGSAPAARGESALPATPKQWVDAYMASAVDNPHRVCSQLLAPQLAAQFAAAAPGGSCTSYFSRVRSTSLQVRQVFHNGGTAVVELHRTIEKNGWTVILHHHGGGWRAVDLAPGRLLR